MMIIYFCQGWTGWLYVTWMPSLFQKNYGLDLKKSSLLYAAMLLSGMIGELLGGMGHRLSAGPCPKCPNCAFAADRRRLVARRNGAGTGDPHP
ncbi:MAG TPA: hypothetical protein VGI28_14635 [Stellaceae bacterium]